MESDFYNKLKKEWHPTKNEDIDFDTIRPGNHKKFWWLCEKGHEWTAVYRHRLYSKSDCPYCTGRKACLDNCLATLKPEIAKEWHPTKNVFTPYQVTCGSNKKVWWLCENGHEWISSISHRTRINANGCPFCSNRKIDNNNSLKVMSDKKVVEFITV
ncbi:MAG: zinc-ribbon domain-containing protein [Thermodesulfovibrio sp.]|nr:zinc-ribbon domain-containing protein [Thermodesulfovibrio sp.]